MHKKITKAVVSSLMSAAMLASMLPFTASADDSIPDKCLYFKPKANSELTIESDGTVVLSRETIKKLGYTMPVDIFFYDKAATCWYVSPKWKCASGFIKIQNVVDPLPIKGEKLPYAYVGEVFGFWVIEGPQSIKDEFPVEKASLPILICDDHKPYKQRKVRMAALYYLEDHDLVPDLTNIRFDVIAILDEELTHVENAF